MKNHWLNSYNDKQSPCESPALSWDTSAYTFCGINDYVIVVDVGATSISEITINDSIMTTNL